MIVLKNTYQNIDMINLRKFFVSILDKEYRKEVYGGSISVMQVSQLYSESEIYDAIHSIYINGNNLEIPERGRNSEIMRYLEFGGEEVRPMHLITKSIKQIRIIGGI